MDRKTIKRIEVLRDKLTRLRQQVAGSKRQHDDPQELQTLTSQVAEVEAQLRALTQAPQKG